MNHTMKNALKNALTFFGVLAAAIVLLGVILAVDNAMTSPRPMTSASAARLLTTVAAVSIPTPPAPSSVPVASSSAPPAPLPPTVSPEVEERLAAHVLEAMRSWVKESKATVPFTELAGDIAHVALREQPAFEGDESRARTAILLAAVADYEGSHFREYVDAQRCNDSAWRAKNAVTMMQGDCDGGIAVSLWQVHYDCGGIALYDDAREWSYGCSSRDGAVPVTREAVRGNRRLAARIALHMMRKSLRAKAGLCQFTGELGPCPKGDERLEHARSWSSKHPFTDPR